MYMCNYKSVFINKLSILKFGADPCRLGHVTFHKNLMPIQFRNWFCHQVFNEETMSFLPFILSQKLDETMKGFFQKRDETMQFWPPIPFA